MVASAKRRTKNTLAVRISNAVVNRWEYMFEMKGSGRSILKEACTVSVDAHNR